ncbi:20 kDa chaperonin family protein [Striga asiatica]|uniref:20 kDa chaperonin, chloroplastic n=1 Tax=Striga asiatica TaxID=4170 RepID=A0A5A7Q6Q8_STRAF|nr:20 kDa chaperonin family protein [Striga asiatica]
MIESGFCYPLVHFHQHHKIFELESKEMAAAQLTSGATSVPAKRLGLFEGLKPSIAVRVSCFSPPSKNGLSLTSSRGLVVRAATIVAPKYTSLKPLGDRVLVKIKTAEEKTSGGILLPTTAQSKPQAGEVVAIGEGRSHGSNEVEISVKSGAQVVYSKYAGTEVEFDGSNHLILKEDDIVGILETDDVKDMKPLNDRVLIKVAEAEEKTAGGLLLTEASKEKPSIGTIIAVGPGPLDKEGKRKPLSVGPGETVLYSKYAGNDFKGPDGSNYVALRASEVIAILS